MLVCGSLCDALGMKRLVAAAFVAHIGGTLLMIFANSFADKFAMLYAGALAISIGDGLLQSVLYPLVATIYPDRKTEMFNKLLLWFPGGMVLGGLVLFAINSFAAPVFHRRTWLGLELWQWKLGLLFVPAVAYGVLFLGQTFPATERVQAGISYGQMFRETFGRPLYWLLLACMMMTASVELGPNAWVTAVLEAKELPGILILVWISLLAAVMRYFAGALGRRVRRRRFCWDRPRSAARASSGSARPTRCGRSWRPARSSPSASAPSGRRCWASLPIAFPRGAPWR